MTYGKNAVALTAIRDNCIVRAERDKAIIERDQARHELRIAIEERDEARALGRCA